MRIFEEVNYGFVNVPHRSTVFSGDADLLIRSPIFASESYNTDMKGWQLHHIHTSKVQINLQK